ncbi:MAG: hypothetical protein JWM28_1344 [Chitinophagaceae bacterium]|nr:hypothetical protein [Chitinophagaceae bacterium]
MFLSPKDQLMQGPSGKADTQEYTAPVLLRITIQKIANLELNVRYFLNFCMRFVPCSNHKLIRDGCCYEEFRIFMKREREWF